MADREEVRLRSVELVGPFPARPDENLNRIARLAHQALGGIAAFVTVVDDEAVWIVGKWGANLERLPKEHAFCWQCVQSKRVLIVEDARQDPVFKLQGIVQNDPRVVFYAGAPISVVDDIHVGTLCIVDDKPRAASSVDTDVLIRLARCAGDELWMSAFGSKPEKTAAEAERAKMDHEPITLNSAQIRAARGLLDWTISDLAQHAGVSPTTVKRLEAKAGTFHLMSRAVLSIRDVFMQHGVAFPSSVPGQVAVAVMADTLIAPR